MDIFFNELSLKIADNEETACEWLEGLANLGKLLKQIIESLDKYSFSFRRTEDFGQQKITDNQTIIEFLQSKFDFSDPVYIFLLGIFDSPYISEDDPKKTEYDLTSITINNVDYKLTGIAAAYIKNSLVVSLNNDDRWNNCQLDIYINKLNSQSEISKQVKNASERKHIINCHLPFLAQLYNWTSYKPHFDSETKKQNILPLLDLCSFYFEEGWDNFYLKAKNSSKDERVSKYKETAEKIAKLHRWDKSPKLTKENDRIVYIIPNSNFIVGLDTEQGEFEIHINKKGKNHLGSISFNGANIKEKKDRELKI